jgi:hypothetical protein
LVVWKEENGNEESEAFKSATQSLIFANFRSGSTDN